jgi:hypothetical protein
MKKLKILFYELLTFKVNQLLNLSKTNKKIIKTETNGHLI